MSFDVVRDERAERGDLEALTRGVIEGGRCEASAKAAPLAGFVYLGMREGNPAVPAPVGDETDQAATEPEFVAVRLRDVDDLGLFRVTGRNLGLVGSAEIVYQAHKFLRC